MTDRKISSCSATLDLVCPPISNSLAAKLIGDEDAEAIIRQSDFYMICGRPEAKFGDVAHDSSNSRLHFSIEVAGGKKDFGWIRIDHIPYVVESPDDVDMRIHYGERQIAFFVVPPDSNEQIIAAFTPDDVLMRRGRKEYIVGGLDFHLDLATYDLLYVGIAKKGDSYDRLFAQGHHARMQIIANEPQRYPGARVSDETYLFLFRVEPLLMKVFGPDSDIEDGDLNLSYDPKRRFNLLASLSQSTTARSIQIIREVKTGSMPQGSLHTRMRFPKEWHFELSLDALRAAENRT